MALYANTDPKASAGASTPARRTFQTHVDEIMKRAWSAFFQSLAYVATLTAHVRGVLKALYANSDPKASPGTST